VVCLVVDGEDVLHPHQLGHDAPQHLPLGLEGAQLLAVPPFEERSGALR
jgi:hypothetical protein